CGWDHVLFFDDAWPALTTVGPWAVVGDGATLLQRVSEFDGVVVAIGQNGIRLKKLNELGEAGAPLPILLHPSAVVSAHASIGVGSVVFANAVVNTGTVTGVGAILNTGSTVDHDCSLGNAVHVSPGAHLAGGVHVGD